MSGLSWDKKTVAEYIQPDLCYIIELESNICPVKFTRNVACNSYMTFRMVKQVTASRKRKQAMPPLFTLHFNIL
jgi:hypothetical protein